MRQKSGDVLPTSVLPKYWLRYTEDDLISWNERKAGEQDVISSKHVEQLFAIHEDQDAVRAEDIHSPHSTV
jgi:hypothetical protein